MVTEGSLICICMCSKTHRNLVGICTIRSETSEGLCLACANVRPEANENFKGGL